MDVPRAERGRGRRDPDVVSGQVRGLLGGVSTVIWLCVPGILLWINTMPGLVKAPPAGGSDDLGNLVRVLLLCVRKAGVRGIGREGFYAHARPSVLAAAGDARTVPWTDGFVDEVRRTMQACAVFCFLIFVCFAFFFSFPAAEPILHCFLFIQACPEPESTHVEPSEPATNTPRLASPVSQAQINDSGLGAAANAQSASLTSNGVSNDLLGSLKSIASILSTFFISYILVPQLRKAGIPFGPIRSIFAGSLVAAVGASAFAVPQHKIYQTSPCGYHASTCSSSEEAGGGGGVSPLSLWLFAIPVLATAPCEPLVYVPAFSLAYAKAPANMKGLVMGLSLCTLALTQVVSLCFAGLVKDPNLVWVFAGPSIVGFVMALVFWFMFRHLDEEEFYLGEKQTRGGGCGGSKGGSGNGSSVEGVLTEKRPEHAAVTQVSQV